MPRIDSKKFYTSTVEIHGISPQGLGWLCKESQEMRFDVILNMLPKSIDTLADAGCGFGDFFTYMDKNNRTPNRYIGIDSLSDMCSIASKNTAQKIVKADICKEEIPYADYYVCSGAMNILSTFETHLFIRNCFNSSKKGFVFNILHGSKQSDTYNYMTKRELNNIAKEIDVKKVKVQDGYMKNDITVGFFK